MIAIIKLLGILLKTINKTNVHVVNSEINSIFGNEQFVFTVS